MKNKIISLVVAIIASANMVNAQTTEIKISLDEQFFDTLLEAVFTHLNEPSVPIAQNNKSKVKSGNTLAKTNINSNNLLESPNYQKDDKYLTATHTQFTNSNSPKVCDESIKLKREIDGVRTAVRFRESKIYAPIAFLGNYNPPLIGCIEFKGWAETYIDLSYDKRKNALVGKAKVVNVNLSGTGGIGSSLLSRFVQSSIDNKVNPIEIISLDKLSFTTPIQNSGKLRMKALGIRHVVKKATIDVFIKYKFEKG